MELFAKYISVYFFSMFKFIAGPITGLATGLGMWETSLFTVLGMMTTVIALTHLGTLLREKVIKRYFKPSKRFSKRNRKFVFIWKQYGIFGVSFLTPVLFSPIVGTLLITSIGGFHQRTRLYAFMLFSGSFWGVILTFIVYQLKYFV